jgi:hypothetical protein
LPKTFSCEEILEKEIGARCAELRGFLENPTARVNAVAYKLSKQKQ